MRFVIFCHSLVSCWNHGNAHFLRGVVRELLLRSHSVRVLEPRDGWSLANLKSEHGPAPLRELRRIYPELSSEFYDEQSPNLDRVLADADVVLVHEWTPRALVARIGQHHARSPDYRLLFHDTHHRAVTQPDEMERYDLRHYDGVLAFGDVLRELYLASGWTRRAWAWHEAADTRLFRPIAAQPCEGDLVWIGNWGDEERSAELHEFLLAPVRRLGLRARVYGVRYPDEARAALKSAGLGYGGWLPNYRAPDVFARFTLTVHVPRRPYVRALPGIPTIRVFEALACGIPLVSAPWRDAEKLFRPGKDFLIARTGNEMRRHLRTLLHEPELRRELAEHGHRTILSRHTCAHRVDELLSIIADLNASAARPRRRLARARSLAPSRN